MRRAATAALTAIVIAVPTGSAAATIQKAADTAATAKKKVVVRKVVGPAAQAHHWGTVTVTLTVRKTTTTTGTKRKVTRRITGVDATYAVGGGRSMMIMEQALPILEAEALQAQSADIDLVSGATDTSEAFVESLQAALLQAKKV
jgi:uncharacterized protein with FMN-binding domain